MDRTTSVSSQLPSRVAYGGEERCHDDGKALVVAVLVNLDEEVNIDYF